MKTTPKSLRLQIGLFGRTNVGKSSFLNMVAGQDVSITSSTPGTTTDIVEKTMELLPLGPVVFLDTGGVDDTSELAGLRIKRTEKIFDRSEVVLLLVEADTWTDYESYIIEESKKRDTPFIIIVNKSDVRYPSDNFIEEIKEKADKLLVCSSVDLKERDKYVNILKQHLINVCPDDFVKPPPLIGDLVPPGGTAVLIIPIDFEAPKGRIILPQVQAIRDLLDNDQAAVIVKESEYKMALGNLKNPPDLVVCDSQVVEKMVSETPDNVKCTTFSILFSRYKGELREAAQAAAVIDSLKPGDKILIAEACSHHAIEGDIGRIKIPKWLSEYVGGDLSVDVCAGRDYPDDLNTYKLVVHCGSCMITRRETLFRIQKAKEQGVRVANYGTCIAFLKGVLKRVLEPFPAVLDAYEREKCCCDNVGV